jgi:hypothetical protein
LAAKLLMLASAGIIFLLGAMHLLYTFTGNLLTPRDPALQITMTQISPVISKQTTMWRAWIGFNATHSMALLLFGIVFGYLALAHAEILFASPFVLTVGAITLAAFALLSKLYFFRAPLIGVSLALACYVAAIVAARLNPIAG